VAWEVRGDWSVFQHTVSRHLRTNAEDVEWIWESFVCSLYKFICRHFFELQIPCSAVHKVLHTCLRLHAYKIQIVQAVRPSDHLLNFAFATDILEWVSGGGGLLTRVVFTVKAAFCVSGRISCYSVRTWCRQKPHVLTHLNPVCWRTLPISIKLLCHSCTDGLLDCVLWHLKVCSSLNEAWHSQPSPGVSIFTFAVTKLITINK
jgi:hypothetical protein